MRCETIWGMSFCAKPGNGKELGALLNQYQEGWATDDPREWHAPYLARLLEPWEGIWLTLNVMVVHRRALTWKSDLIQSAVKSPSVWLCGNPHVESRKQGGQRACAQVSEGWLWFGPGRSVSKKVRNDCILHICVHPSSCNSKLMEHPTWIIQGRAVNDELIYRGAGLGAPQPPCDVPSPSAHLCKVPCILSSFQITQFE